MPALLIHGDQDTDVPLQQSLMMNQVQKRAGVPTELKVVKNHGHGFDGRRMSRDKAVKEVFDQVLEFLSDHL